MKNLIIIHLESVSNNVLYNASKEVFPNLYQVMEKSCTFQNYYSTATSTIMTIGDLMYGDLYQLERSRNLNDVFKQKTINSLFESLSREGYRTSAYIYPCFEKINKMDRVNLKKILGYDTHYEEVACRDQFYEKISNTITNENAFAIYVYDSTSLLSSPFRKENINHNFVETVEESYRKIDQTVGFIFETLQKKGILEDTVVVLFGDHGDDLYSHGFSNGFTHAIEPYASVIRTPLVVYSIELKPNQYVNLINTLDIRKMVISLLQNQDTKELIRHINRTYSFSRNLFWNQKSDVLNQAYSITDGEYMLMVSSKGLELYFCKYDVFGLVNLLNFFDLYRKSIRLKKEIRYIDGQHIEYMLRGQVNSIQNKFIILKEELLKSLAKMQVHTCIRVNYNPWFQNIRTNSQIQKELKNAVLHGKTDLKTRRLRGLKKWMTNFVS